MPFCAVYALLRYVVNARKTIYKSAFLKTGQKRKTATKRSSFFAFITLDRSYRESGANAYFVFALPEIVFTWTANTATESACASVKTKSRPV